MSSKSSPPARPCVCCGGLTQLVSSVVIRGQERDGEDSERAAHVYECIGSCFSWNRVLRSQRPFRIAYDDDVLTRGLLPEPLRLLEAEHAWPELPEQPEERAACYRHGGPN